MNSIIKGLLGLCLFLLLVFFIEWQVIGFNEKAIELLENKAESTKPLLELPKLVLTKQAVESYSHMVETPLFIEGRTPIMSDGEEKKSIEEITEIDDLILLGIYSIKDKMFALFNKKGKGSNYSKISEGEDINGWKLIKITADNVIIERRGKEQTLMLRKPKPKEQKRKRPRKLLNKMKLKNPEK